MASGAVEYCRWLRNAVVSSEMSAWSVSGREAVKLPARSASASGSVPVKELVKSSGGLVRVQF
jgi:hypothetical protein